MARYGMDYGGYGGWSRSRRGFGRMPGGRYGADYRGQGYAGRGSPGTRYWGGEYEAGYGGFRDTGPWRGYGGRGNVGRNPRGRGARGYDRVSYGVGYGDRAATFTAYDVAYRHGYDRRL